jgi:hypothetical protein
LYLSAQGSEGEVHCGIPAVGEDEGAEVDDVLAAVVLPPAARPFHAHADEGLAGGLDVAAADGQSCLSGIGVVHPLAVVFDVRERLVDGPSVASHHVALARLVQFAGDAPDGAGLVEK